MICRLNDDYYVRPLALEDVAGPYPGWFEDQEVCRYNSHGKFFGSKESFRSYVTRANDERSVVWAICHGSDGHVGNISLQAMSFINRTAEFAIILGDKRHWGVGLGRLAGLALLDHGFNKLNLERVYCGTAATNRGMIKLAAALGMRHEGISRGHLFLEGVRVDLHWFGVLRDEFMNLPRR